MLFSMRVIPCLLTAVESLVVFFFGRHFLGFTVYTFFKHN